MTASERERMILSLRPNVIGVVNRIFISLPSGVNREDMISEAWLGAIAAVDQFESARGLKLQTFAEHKIRSRILDFLRSADTVSRRERSKIKAGDSTAPVIVPLSKAADFRDSRAQELIGRLEGRSDLRVYLHRAKLTRRQRFVLKRRYWNGARDREIASEIHVSESRVSQLHARAIAKLRG